MDAELQEKVDEKMRELGALLKGYKQDGLVSELRLGEEGAHFWRLTLSLELTGVTGFVHFHKTI